MARNLGLRPRGGGYGASGRCSGPRSEVRRLESPGGDDGPPHGRRVPSNGRRVFGGPDSHHIPASPTTRVQPGQGPGRGCGPRARDSHSGDSGSSEGRDPGEVGAPGEAIQRPGVFSRDSLFMLPYSGAEGYPGRRRADYGSHRLVSGPGPGGEGGRIRSPVDLRASAPIWN